MNRPARIALAAAALVAAVALVRPLWHIGLEAPQYPEGLGMYIWADRITGEKPQDLNSINGLNHYIGMKAIVPESIPELRIMPYLVGGLTLFGLVSAAIGDRRLLYVWTIAFAVLALVGLADFWKWGYQYGHDLDPTAAIRIPGMAYQPPLIGTRQLLNFRATSWPALGGLALMAALATGVALCLREWRRAGLALGALALFAGCGAPGPAPFAYGDDQCAQCHMTLADPRFSAQLVTRRHRVYRFDDPGCLADFVAGGTVTAAEVGGAWVSDYLQPDSVLKVEDAVFLQSDAIRTPMDHRIAALRPGPGADSLAAALNGELIRWDAVVANAGGARLLAGTQSPTARELVVTPDGPLSTVADAVRLSRPGDRIVIRSGLYRMPGLVLDRRVELVGEGRPRLESSDGGTLLRVTADGVVVRGLTLAGVQASYTDDRAAILLDRVRDCVIEDVTIERSFFGVYGRDVRGCRIAGNTIRGSNSQQRTAGNAIHFWNSRDLVVAGNEVTGHRDGIYFEFVRRAQVTGNTSAGNLRYGLHFMYSDSNEYRDNRFLRNRGGVAVMYSRRVLMLGNRFEDSNGPASYGLLLKDITDSRLEANRFRNNTVALVVESSSRLVVDDNDFLGNGWAIRLPGSSTDNRFTGNRFAGNSFDVATNSRTSFSTFERNYWDRYDGYDLDRDGIGDVPHRPVRLFSLLVAQNEPAVILLRSPFVDLLEAAERVLPILSPAGLVDRAPLMALP